MVAARATLLPEFDIWLLSLFQVLPEGLEAGGGFARDCRLGRINIDFGSLEVVGPAARILFEEVTQWIYLAGSVSQHLAGEGLPEVHGLVDGAYLFAIFQTEYLDLTFHLACQNDIEMRADVNLEKQIGVVLLATACPKLAHKVHFDSLANIIWIGDLGWIEFQLVKLALAHFVQ